MNKQFVLIFGLILSSLIYFPSLLHAYPLNPEEPITTGQFVELFFKMAIGLSVLGLACLKWLRKPKVETAKDYFAKNPALIEQIKQQRKDTVSDTDASPKA